MSNAHTSWQTALGIIFLIGFFLLLWFPLWYLHKGIITVTEAINIQKGIASTFGPLAGSIIGFYYGARRARAKG